MLAGNPLGGDGGGGGDGDSERASKREKEKLFAPSLRRLYQTPNRDIDGGKA